MKVFKDNKIIKRKLDRTNEISDELVRLKSESESVNKTLILSNNTAYLRKEILANMGEVERQFGVTLRNLDQPKAYKQSDLMIETYMLVFDGDFNSTVKGLKFLQEKLEYGKISSLRMNSEYNRVTKELDLVTALYIQHVKRQDK